MIDNAKHWHLMKHDDGTVFGPVTFAQIQEWARAAQVSPLDKVSKDQMNWSKAPMYPELEMDWLLQLNDDHFYGPTTITAMQEFIQMGDIDENTIVINCKDASVSKVSAMTFPSAKKDEEEDSDDALDGADPEFAELLQRVKKLEETAAHDQQRLADLETKLQALLDALGAKVEPLPGNEPDI